MNEGEPRLRSVIGFPSAVLLVVGGVIGVGIFVNPAVVAHDLGSPTLILLAWALGGLIALAGALSYAELGRRMPNTGGEYVYLRTTFGPLAGFLFGWTTLLVVHSGGMAAVCIVFARNLNLLVGGGLDERAVVIATLALLGAVNCAGVKAGNGLQGGLGLLKCLGIAALIAVGLLVVSPAHPPRPEKPLIGIQGFGAAMIPVVFSYGGWQTANYVAGEMKNAPRVLSRALVVGVLIVIVLYLLVNVACLRALGASALGATLTPVADVLTRGLGDVGGKAAAAGVALSALAFVSQGMLTGPRVTYAMARDGLFFRALGEVGERARTPALAVAFQAIWAGVLAFSGRYDQILSYVVSMNFLFFGLTAATLFFLPRRPGDRLARICAGVFIVAAALVVGSAFWAFPVNSLIGYLILVLGIGPYLFWRRRSGVRAAVA